MYTSNITHQTVSLEEGEGEREERREGGRRGGREGGRRGGREGRREGGREGGRGIEKKNVREKKEREGGRRGDNLMKNAYILVIFINIPLML